MWYTRTPAKRRPYRGSDAVAAAFACGEAADRAPSRTAGQATGHRHNGFLAGRGLAEILVVLAGSSAGQPLLAQHGTDRRPGKHG